MEAASGGGSGGGGGGSGKKGSSGNTPRVRVKKQKSSKQDMLREAVHADRHADYFTLTRDPKLEFGINFKVKNFGNHATKLHHMLKKDTEYLVVRNLRNFPDGTLGPATLQGIEEDDILLHLDGAAVTSFADFAARTKSKKDIKVAMLRLEAANQHRRANSNWNKASVASAFANPLHHKASADSGFLPSIGR